MIAQIPAELSALFTQQHLVWATAAWLLLQNAGRAYHAVAAGGGLVSIWRGLIFGTNVPRTDTSVGAGGRLPGVLLPVLLSVSLCAGFFLVSGCGTTPQQASYQAAGTTVTTVDAAMTAWGDYVKQYHPPVAQELQVKAAYEKYQASMVLLVDATQIYVTLSGSGSTNAPPAADKVTILQQQASQAFADLLALLNQFGVKL
jgi:hypothetical protein